MLDQIVKSLKAHFSAQLVDELLSAYQEAKKNFFIGGLRLSAVEGGRFCEAALRMLEEKTTGTFTNLNQQLDAEKLIEQLKNTPKASHPASIRLHIPRAIRVIYDIRNARDNAHLADGIDPNLQDATFVISNADWILAELVRQYHNVAATEAQRIVDGLVTRTVPAVQDFDGFLKVLNPKLKVSEYVLLLLYERGTTGASYAELEKWVQPSMTANLRRTLTGLVHGRAFIHDDGKRFYITKRGMSEVQKQNLHHID
jgi:hypothetical protein